jgi:hypothetical protein
MTDTEQGWMKRAAERIEDGWIRLVPIKERDYHNIASDIAIIREEYAKERAERVEKLRRMYSDLDCGIVSDDTHIVAGVLQRLGALIAEEENNGSR